MDGSTPEDLRSCSAIDATMTAESLALLVPEIETGEGDEESSLDDLVDQLDHDPQECWRAYLGLISVDDETRVRIIGELARQAGRDGLDRLFRLLSTSRDASTRQAALRALGEGRLAIEGPTSRARGIEGPTSRARGVDLVSPGPMPTGGTPIPLANPPRLIRCLVTPIDGEGRGVIAISSMVKFPDGAGSWCRATAAFECDVELGVTDVVGEIEEESEDAGNLIDAIRNSAPESTGAECPDLAIGLLAGCLLLNQPPIPDPVARWLERTMGGQWSGRRSAAVPLGADHSPSETVDAPGRGELRIRTWELLAACPSWVDRSALVFELAEEIWLRHGRRATDPRRDAGAYRYFFEHRLIHRLEAYRRMLLWMAGVWDATANVDLACTAEHLAWQLGDAQFAVPSHPFAVAMTTRSLEEAQRLLGTAADPRGKHRGR